MTKKQGKKYTDAKKLIDSTKKYDLEKAIELVKKASYCSFDASIELHLNTNANPKYNDQNIRSSVMLPNGTGQDVKVAAFVSSDKVDEAKSAGADIAGSDEIVEMVNEGDIDFDVVVASPDMMSELAKIARILGPKGLMPSPKAGTVSDDVEKMVSEVKKGKFEYRLDNGGNLHIVVGNEGFDNEKIKENIEYFIDHLIETKPSGVSGKLIKKAYLAPTMGPSVKIKL